MFDLIHRWIAAKPKRIIFFVLFSVIILASILTIFYRFRDTKIPADNTTPSEELVSRRYNDFLLLQMEADYEEYSIMTLHELEEAYHVKLECRRITETNGYTDTNEYYVLVSEHGGKAFIFTSHGLVSNIVFLRYALYSDELTGAVHQMQKELCFYPPAVSAEVLSYGGNTISKVYVVENGFITVDYGFATMLHDRGPVLKTQFYTVNEYSDIVAKSLDKILLIDTQGLPLQHFPEPMG